MFALLAMVFSLPSLILNLSHLDVRRFAPDVTPEAVPIANVIAAMVAIGITLIAVPIRVSYYHVAAVEWRRVRGGSGPLMLSARGNRWTGVIVGILRRRSCRG